MPEFAVPPGWKVDSPDSPLIPDEAHYGRHRAVRNWRGSRIDKTWHEVDVAMGEHGTVQFVEVRPRQSAGYTCRHLIASKAYFEALRHRGVLIPIERSEP